MGLNRPRDEQFAIYVWDVLQGDLGTSVLTANPVIEDIKRVFPATLELATVATLFGVLLGVPMGVLAGVYAGRWPDQAIRVIGLLGYSIPVFWLGLMGLLLFYAKIGRVPGPGRLDFFYAGPVEPVTAVLLIETGIERGRDKVEQYV